MCERAKITVTPAKDVNEPLEYLAATIETTTDIPADALGEVTAKALDNLWSAVGDPVGHVLIVSFGVAK